MADREQILDRIRTASQGNAPHPGGYPLPLLEGGFHAFASRLRSVGGEAHGPIARPNLGEAAQRLVNLRSDGGRILIEPSAEELVGAGPWAVVPKGTAPGDFEDVSVAFLRGTLACAENAAVAVEGRHAPNRSLPFLCRHLVLIVPVNHVPADLHSAQFALPSDALSRHHLTWISGPSKTADIEQTVVFGAHGPLTLDVIGYTEDGEGA